MRNTFRWRYIFVLIAGFIGLLANTAWAESKFYGFVSKLDGAQQVPSNSSLATGFGKSSYDPATNKLSLSINVTGISKANLTGAHIHLGATGSSGPIILDLGLTGWQTTATGISLNTTLTFPEANELELINGNTYLNLHTTTFTGGEIRGQNIVAAKLVSLGYATPSAASADGKTVVGAYNNQAFRWTATGGVQGIGFPLNAVELCDNTCTLSSSASAISADGLIIAGQAFTKQGTSNAWEAFRWTAADGFLGLGNISLYPYGNVANGISDDGSTIVGAQPGGSLGFRWTAATGLVKFPYISGETLYATSGNGEVSVGVSGINAAEWPSGDQMVKLNPLSGAFSSSASDISSDASVIAGFSDIGQYSPKKAVRWITANSPLLAISLGDLANESSSYTTGISGDGKTIVGWLNRSTISGEDGYVWTEQSGKRLLTDLLAERGADITGWRFNVINGISRDATTIVGYGYFNNLYSGYITYLNPEVTLPLPPPPPPPPPASADMALTMTDSPDPAKKLSKLTYSIVVKNKGLDAASSVTLTDTLPSNVTFLSAAPTQGTCIGTNTVNCTLGYMANGATAIVTITVRTKAAGIVSNTASVSSAVADPNSANNKATVTTTVK